MHRLRLDPRAFAAAAVLALAAAPGALAQPMEYVRVCDIYGTSWYYEPGTETCIHADTGDTRRETEIGTIFGQTDLADQVTDQRIALDGMSRDIDDLRDGIAAAAALPRPYVDPGHRFAVAGDWGQYEGSNAFGVGAAFRLDETFTFSGSAAVPVQGGGVATRAGFNASW